MTIRPIILIAALFFAACSKKPDPPKFDQLRLTYKQAGQTIQRRIPIVFALVDPTTITRTEVDGSQTVYGQHWFCLANYDVSEKPEKPNTSVTKDLPPEADIAPVKACVTINDKAGTNAASPLQPGTYFIGLTAQMPERISSGGIFWDKGKLGSTSLFTLAEMKGSLRLDSVSDEVVSGEIDVSDSDTSITGTFNLKPKIIKKIVPPMN